MCQASDRLCLHQKRSPQNSKQRQEPIFVQCLLPNLGAITPVKKRYRTNREQHLLTMLAERKTCCTREKRWQALSFIS
ncbi:MAG: hypothetical protein V7L23_33485 [Nostoc sp.]|uniref:hypothetical protein n=1 Tax=Nostoc sp. TaxID=1180 RepID=UPI002FF23542